MEVLTSNTSIEKTPTGEEKKGGSATMDTKERITLQKVFDTLQAAAPEIRLEEKVGSRHGIIPARAGRMSSGQKTPRSGRR